MFAIPVSAPTMMDFVAASGSAIPVNLVLSCTNPNGATISYSPSSFQCPDGCSVVAYPQMDGYNYFIPSKQSITIPFQLKVDHDSGQYVFTVYSQCSFVDPGATEATTIYLNTTIIVYIESDAIKFSVDPSDMTVYQGITKSFYINSNNLQNTPLSVSSVVGPDGQTLYSSLEVPSMGGIELSIPCYAPKLGLNTQTISVSYTYLSGSQDEITVSRVQSFSYTVNCLPIPEVLQIPSSLALSDYVGSVAKSLIIVANPTQDPVQVASITDSNSANALAQNVTVAANRTLSVEFDYPSTAQLGTINVSYSHPLLGQAANVSRQIAYTVASQPAVLVFDPLRVDFGAVAVRQSATKTFYIRNYSKNSIQINSIGVPDGVSLDWSGGILFKGESRLITATFSAAAVGVVNGSLSFTYTAGQVVYQSGLSVKASVYDDSAQQQQAVSQHVADAEQASADVSRNTKRAVWNTIYGNSIAYEYYDGTVTQANPSGQPLLKKKTYYTGGVPIFSQVFTYDANQRIILEVCNKES